MSSPSHYPSSYHCLQEHYHHHNGSSKKSSKSPPRHGDDGNGGTGSPIATANSSNSASPNESGSSNSDDENQLSSSASPSLPFIAGSSSLGVGERGETTHQGEQGQVSSSSSLRTASALDSSGTIGVVKNNGVDADGDVTMKNISASKNGTSSSKKTPVAAPPKVGLVF